MKKKMNKKQKENINSRLNRVIILGAILLVYGVILFVDNYINAKTTWQYIFSVGIFAISFIFIGLSIKLKANVPNKTNKK